jgi:pimeloyl-ACP methyl ester carboxylesterase
MRTVAALIVLALVLGEWVSAQDSLVETAWLDMQRELASRSSQGRLVVAQKSGHYVQAEEPELVISAIREVVAAVRRRAAGR